MFFLVLLAIVILIIVFKKIYDNKQERIRAEATYPLLMKEVFSLLEYVYEIRQKLPEDIYLYTHIIPVDSRGFLYGFSPNGNTAPDQIKISIHFTEFGNIIENQGRQIGADKFFRLRPFEGEMEYSATTRTRFYGSYKWLIPYMYQEIRSKYPTGQISLNDGFISIRSFRK